MDAAAEGGDVDAFFVPFVRADKAEQEVEGQQKGGVVGVVIDVCEGGADVGGAGQAEGEIRADFDGEHIGKAALLRLSQAVAVEGGGGVGGLPVGLWFAFFRRPAAVQAFFQGGEDLFGVVEIAGEDGGSVGAGVLQDGGGVGFAPENGVFRRFLRAFAAPFAGGVAVGGDFGGHGKGRLKRVLGVFEAV